jgi:hypothetical protein
VDENLLEQIDNYRASLTTQGDEMRDPYWALRRLEDVYRNSEGSEREALNEAICRWLDSDEQGKWYDAVWLIDEFKITEAVPALERLLRRLEKRSGPAAADDEEWIQGALERLKRSQRPGTDED